MASKDEVPKGLKILVISMGILLVGGFFAVAGIVVTRLAGHTSEDMPGKASAFDNAACNARNFDIPEGFDLDDLYADRGVVTALISSDNASRVMTIDACSGQVLTDLTLNDGKSVRRKTPVDYSF